MGNCNSSAQLTAEDVDQNTEVKPKAEAEPPAATPEKQEVVSAAEPEDIVEQPVPVPAAEEAAAEQAPPSDPAKAAAAKALVAREEEEVAEAQPEEPVTEPEAEPQPQEVEADEMQQPPSRHEEEKDDSPGSSQETTDGTRQAESWVFTMDDDVEKETESPELLLKRAVMKFRPQIMRLPGVRGIRVKTQEGGPVVILRVSHKQCKWESVPEFLEENAEGTGCVAEYFLVNDGEKVTVGDLPARIRVISKKPKATACLEEPDNVIRQMQGGCAKEGCHYGVDEEVAVVAEPAEPEVAAEPAAEEAAPEKGAPEEAPAEAVKGEQEEGEPAEAPQPTNL